MKKFVAAMMIMVMVLTTGMIAQAEVESRYFTDTIKTWDVNGNEYTVEVYFVEYTSDSDDSVVLQVTYDEYVEAMTEEYEAQESEDELTWYETVYTTLAFWK